MQVFIPYADSICTALCLDRKRLHNQINECSVILQAIQGGKAWANHPVSLMYREHTEWLKWYRKVIKKAYCSELGDAAISELCQTEPQRPYFIGMEDLHRAHRSRLFQKSPGYYKDFANDADFTDCNWFIVDQEVRKYRNGKLIERCMTSRELILPQN